MLHRLHGALSHTLRLGGGLGALQPVVTAALHLPGLRAASSSSSSGSESDGDRGASSSSDSDEPHGGDPNFGHAGHWTDGGGEEDEVLDDPPRVTFSPADARDADGKPRTWAYGGTGYDAMFVMSEPMRQILEADDKRSAEEVRGWRQRGGGRRGAGGGARVRGCHQQTARAPSPSPSTPPLPNRQQLVEELDALEQKIEEAGGPTNISQEDLRLLAEGIDLYFTAAPEEDKAQDGMDEEERGMLRAVGDALNDHLYGARALRQCLAAFAPCTRTPSPHAQPPSAICRPRSRGPWPLAHPPARSPAGLAAPTCALAPLPPPAQALKPSCES